MWLWFTGSKHNPYFSSIITCCAVLRSPRWVSDLEHYDDIALYSSWYSFLSISPFANRSLRTWRGSCRSLSWIDLLDIVEPSVSACFCFSVFADLAVSVDLSSCLNGNNILRSFRNFHSCFISTLLFPIR